jgi:hypothetical protein
MQTTLFDQPATAAPTPALASPRKAASRSAAGERSNWIAVASADHARRGRDAQFDLRRGRDAGTDSSSGFMQVCHGKRAPLARVQPGDRVVYYAPTLGATRRSLPPKGALASWDGPAMRDAPTLGATRRSLPPKGALASWDGPAMRDAPTLAAMRRSLPPRGALASWDGTAMRDAPTITMGGKDKLQSFVSIGIVQSAEPYAFDMGGGFVPYRRDVHYLKADDAPIAPLLDAFEFIEDRQRWGYKFRFGLFKISDHDMRLIAQAMHAPLNELYFS